MDEIQKVLYHSITKLIANSTTNKKIISLKKKHQQKLHFIPIRYRMLGGILQSMNIQFGNFIEQAMSEFISLNPKNEIIRKYSGKKSNKFEITDRSEVLIDQYISRCQTDYGTSEAQLLQNYHELVDKIKVNEYNKQNNTQYFKHDVDVLFKDRSTDIYYYVEIKYNDDHDTGKFIDINRKLLKTYAYLLRELGSEIKLKAILFYFNNKKMKGNIYVPETEVIYRGKRFFDTFTTLSYEELDRYMKEISEDTHTLEVFDDLYKKVVLNPS